MALLITDNKRLRGIPNGYGWTLGKLVHSSLDRQKTVTESGTEVHLENLGQPVVVVFIFPKCLININFVFHAWNEHGLLVWKFLFHSRNKMFLKFLHRTNFLKF